MAHRLPLSATGGLRPEDVTVLVVGAAPELGDAYRAQLRPERYRLLEARGCHDALELLRQHRVDVLVVDQAMPDMTGTEFLEEARKTAPEAIRILCSGVVDTKIARDAVSRAQAFRLLVEPLGTDGLRSVVRQGLELRRTHSGNAEIDPSGAGGAQEAARVKGFLDGLLPKLPAGLLEIDPSGSVRHADEMAQLILGLRDGSIVGEQAIDVGLPCREGDCSSRSFEKPLCSNREVSMVNHWGHRRILLWSCEAVTAGEGVGGCTASVIDISEKDDLEVKIFTAKHEIEAIFDSITDPTFLVDAHRRVLRANRALSRHAGKPFREVLGRSCSEVLHGKAGSCERCSLSTVFETARLSCDEARCSDGQIYKIHFFPLVRRGRVEQVVVRYQNVTAERELEERLLQSEKMASIGQLSAGIAHEINNPMGFIFSNLDHISSHIEQVAALSDEAQGIAEGALLGNRDPREAWEAYMAARSATDVDFRVKDLRELVRECHEGAERIRKIIVALRAFSHPCEQKWEWADLHEGIESTLNIVWNELKHRCRVVRDYCELPKVLCQPQQINQVFMNLLVNAAQAIPGRGTLTLRTRPLGDRVCVAIADTGEGIAPENFNRVFDPFFTTKPVGKGTGLGLHLALGIVRKHGGEIQVDSAPGQGTTFTVILPVLALGAPRGYGLSVPSTAGDPADSA